MVFDSPKHNLAFVGRRCNAKSELDGDLTGFCLCPKSGPLFKATEARLDATVANFAPCPGNGCGHAALEASCKVRK